MALLLIITTMPCRLHLLKAKVLILSHLARHWACLANDQKKDDAAETVMLLATDKECVLLGTDFVQTLTSTINLKHLYPTSPSELKGAHNRFISFYKI